MIDKGEGQTPNQFPDTFLSLKRTNKAKIGFVQGKYNCGGTGVLPFCGERGYQLIASRRHPDIPSNPSQPDVADPSHELWGFTLVRHLLPSESVYDTTTWVYFAPDGSVPRFAADEVTVIPDVSPDTVGDESDEGKGGSDGKAKGKRRIPKPYAKGLTSGTLIKMYNFQWGRRGLIFASAADAEEPRRLTRPQR